MSVSMGWPPMSCLIHHGSKSVLLQAVEALPGGYYRGRHSLFDYPVYTPSHNGFVCYLYLRQASDAAEIRSGWYMCSAFDVNQEEYIVYAFAEHSENESYPLTWRVPYNRHKPWAVVDIFSMNSYLEAKRDESLEVIKEMTNETDELKRQLAEGGEPTSDPLVCKPPEPAHPPREPCCTAKATGNAAHVARATTKVMTATAARTSAPCTTRLSETTRAERTRRQV